MTEAELKTAFLAREGHLKAWGEFVSETIVAELRILLRGRPVDEFLKIPPQPRVKNLDSFIAKALHRGKSYANPLAEITDQVGVRFVTLLASEIDTISGVVEASPHWNTDVARDVAEEKRRRPNEFDYQSQHFIAHSLRVVEFHGVVVPPGIACEIQIRTLLQHAFAELAHNTTYKPKLGILPMVRREVAKTSALIETTDAIFDSVSRTISQADYESQCVQEMLQMLYVNLVGMPASLDHSTGAFILDGFRDSLSELTEVAVKSFFSEKPFLLARIKEHVARGEWLFAQPVVLGLYFLVSKHRAEVPLRWLLEQELLCPLYTEQGFSFSGNSIA